MRIGARWALERELGSLHIVDKLLILAADTGFAYREGWTWSSGVPPRTLQQSMIALPRL
jgi:hypothetical protein